MSRYDELKALAKEAHEKGDRETAERAMDEMESMKSRSIGERATGAAEVAATLASGIAAEVPAGLRGLGTLAANIGDPYALNKAGRAVESHRAGSVYSPRTEAGQEYLGNVGRALAPVGRAISAPGRFLGEKVYGATGSPGLATVAGAAPEALLAIATAAKPKPANTPGFLYDASGLPKSVPRPRIAPSVTPPKIVRGSDEVDDMIPDRGYQDIVQGIDKQRARVVAEDIKPDREILAASERQGITLNPSAYSKNPTYIELEQSLKSRPGSKLAEAEITAIRQIGEKADSLIEDLGGSADRTVFDFKLRTKIDGTIDDLASNSKVHYDKARAAINPRAVVDAPSAKAYIQSTLDDLGGNKARLSPVERDLLDLLDDEKTLTYASLDRLRRDIGSAYEGKGPYGDASTRILDDVYGALSDDQLRVADAFGVGGSLRAGNALTQSKKELQKAAQSLFGRTLEKSVLPRVRTVAVDLSKGNTSSLTSLLNTVPKAVRQDTAVAVLNEVFTSGSRTGSSVGSGFANAYRGLSRNKGALDALIKELPEGAAQRFNDLGKIADGLFRAKAMENTSKTARDVIAALDQPRTIAKLYKGAGEIGAFEGITTASGLPGVGTVGALAHIALKGKTPATVAADQFLGSAALRKAIDMVARGDVPGADLMISKSPAYTAWVNTLPASEAERVARIGVIGWLTSQDEEAE